MQRLFGLAAAAALFLSAELAYAAEMTGYVTNINATQSSFMVGDTLFTASPANTVGTALADLKQGDKVSVRYHESGSGQPRGCKQRDGDRAARARRGCARG